MTWRIESVGQFYDASEDAVVYFDPSSGDTHLLSDFAAYIIQQFADQSMGIETLTSRISPAIESADSAELAEAVVAVVEELVTLDILKRV